MSPALNIPGPPALQEPRRFETLVLLLSRGILKMRFLSLISLLAVPATVLACEGDCIVGCTNAWLGNYTTVIDSVMNSLVSLWA